MANYTLSIPESLTFNCECFKSDSLLQNKKVAAKNTLYVEQEKNRCNRLYDEIQKHQFFDFHDMKPCYGVSTTTAFQLRASFFRHQATIKRILPALKKSVKDVYIKFGNGKEVSVSIYARTLMLLIKAKISSIENFTDYSSPVCIQTLKDSVRDHLNSLEVLENVIQTYANEFDKLEVYLDSPI